MAITKLISQDSNEAVMQAALEHGEAMCSLIEHENGIKSASSALVSKDLLETYRPEHDGIACIHLIAMGNSDQYGFNRNGDWFSGDVLEKRAHTFVTNGHMFREHRNKDPKEAIGQVKWAGYDPKGMQRVEIIVHMDRDKAEEEYDMIKKGEALNFSMSCRVPNDRCSCCGNEAKKLSEYCSHLKSQMGQYVSSFDKYACAINDNPTFFDISRVGVPADRIARHLEYLEYNGDNMRKSASVHGTHGLIPSGVLAEAEGVNLNTFELDEMCMLRKLASAEDFASAKETISRQYHDKRAHLVTNIAPNSMQEVFSADELQRVRAAKPETLFRELSKRACVLSLPAFCQYISGDVKASDNELCKQASVILPGIFGRMLSCASSMIPCCSMFQSGSHFMSECDSKKDDLVQNVMDSAEQKFSMESEPVKQRTIRIIISVSGKAPEMTVKKASFSRDAEDLAMAYAQYQVRALCDIQSMDNHQEMIDNMCDLIAGSNNSCY